MVADVRHVPNVGYLHLHETVSGPEDHVNVTLYFNRSSRSIRDAQFKVALSTREHAVCGGCGVGRRTSVADLGLFSYLPFRLLFPRIITAPTCIFGLESRETVRSSLSSSVTPTSLATTITSSSFEVGL